MFGFIRVPRQTLWMKGETSGNVLNVSSISLDCDADTLLIKAEPLGPTCHTGNESCFFTQVHANDAIPPCDQEILFHLYKIIEGRKTNPVEGSYTNYLFEKGIDKILKKVGEESAETIIAAKNRSAEEVTYETSDLIYHLLVMLSEQGVRPEAILKTLAERHNGKY